MSEFTFKKIKPLPWFWLLLILWIGLDQSTKHWAIESLRPQISIPVIQGYWNWTYVENTGVAFGFLQGHNNILGLIVLLILGLSYGIASDFDWRSKEVNLLGSMILAGGLGNGWDRFQHGFVIDFVDWHYRGYHWPAFNVADSLICISVTWIILRQLFPAKK